MTRKKLHLASVTFKVEEQLAELLNQMPNRSEFIRKAIAAQLGMTCPLCHGKAVVNGLTHERFAVLLSALQVHTCAHCGKSQLVPPDPASLGDPERARLQQFLDGGPLYCGDCYEHAQPCRECAWRIDGETLEVHVKSAHPARK